MKETSSAQGFGKSLIITALALSIAACQLMGPRKPAEPVAAEPEEPVESIPTPTDSLTPSQRVRKALRQLQQGDYENARNELNWALQEKPSLKTATNLLEQMDADPIDYLGLKSFFYDVQPGDSLSIIAKEFLDDPLKFVILARYNKLDNPSKLAPGQRIRVPGEMPEIKKPKPKRQAQPEPAAQPAPALPPPPATETVVAPTEPLQQPTATEPAPAAQSAEPALQMTATQLSDSDGIVESAKKLRAENNLAAAISLLEQEGDLGSGPEEARNLLARYYNEQADQLIGRNKLEDARTTLEKLIILDSSDENAINKLILVEDRIEALKLLQNARDQQNAGKLEQAYQTYSQVLTYDPDNLVAKEAQLQVRNQLTDSYHRQAMQLFRKQQLDEAIGFWNKILDLDPNHSLAPGYKARALEMKQQLQKIGPES